MGFAEMAEAAGLKRKPYYTVAEVARSTGIPDGVIRDAKDAGEITYFLPTGRSRGVLFKPEWVDEWLEKGVVNAV